MEAVGFGFLAMFIALAIICIAIPVVTGLYVYKDASDRRMNALLWAAVTIFIPGFIGLIIYLISRNENGTDYCPKCGKKVRNEFLVCPECAYPLKQTCPKCLHPLAYDWNLCPNCANPVPEYMRLEKPVRKKKDRGLRVIFTLVIVVPFLIFAVMAATGFFIFSNVTSDTVNTEIVSVEAAEFEDIASVIIDTDGYSENVRVAEITFFKGDNMCFGVGVPAYDESETSQNPMIINYTFSEVWNCECDSVVVTLTSNDYKTLAVSDKTTIRDNNGNLDDCMEFSILDEKLVRTDI